MADVTCARCGRTAPALASPPFPGTLGGTIHQRVCASCWAEWEKMQVMVINEYHLSLGNPRARETLMGHMKEFLNLKG